MKNYIVLSALALIFFSSSCSKTTDPVWTVYYETNCAPVWVHGNSDRKSKRNLEALLKDNNIIPLKIKVEGERNPGCAECECTTGKAYRVQIDESQLGLIMWFGFALE